MPTCGMANLVAMLTFCAPRRAASCSRRRRTFSSSEAMGITEIARLEPCPLWAADGRLDPSASRSSIAENSAAMLVLENTHTRAGGTTLSVELTAELAAAAKRHDCRVHLDGARLFNASVALGVPLAELAAPANSVVVSLNKALSAPIGAVLAGSEAVVERRAADAASARRRQRAPGRHRRGRRRSSRSTRWSTGSPTTTGARASSAHCSPRSPVSRSGRT